MCDANSLLSPVEWRPEIQDKIVLNSFDVILTNPPFGAGASLVVDDPQVLDQFELTRYESNNPRSAIPPERLFVERCLQLLKPGGRVAIVLPDSILSNPGLTYMRHWILSKCRVLASIDLPTETFEAFGGTGTQTSVLLLQKKTSDQVKLEEAARQMDDYEVFMAICQTMGYDRRGNDLWQRTPEGEIVERESQIQMITRTPDGVTLHEPKREMLPVRNDDVSEVAPLFEKWLSEKKLVGWLNSL